MCGIVGYISGYTNGFSSAEMKAVEDMLYVDALRGVDSTGVFGVDKYGSVVVHKEASHAKDFMETEEFGQFKRDMVWTGKIVVGHNRAATRGNVTDRNAHPFVVDDKIVLVQNGTYKGCHKHHKDVEVDTEAVAHVISENEDIEEALKKVNAAYALVWYNYETQTLHIIRNSERPLYLAYPKGGGLVFASEKETITWACERNKIVLNDPPYLLKEHHIINIKLEKGGKCTWDSKDIESKYVPPPPVVVQKTVSPPVQQHPRIKQVAYIDKLEEMEGVKQRGPNTIANNFQQYIIRYRPELLVAQAEVYSMMEAANQIKKDNNDDVYVEAFDYIPANNQRDCSAWFVFGTLLGANQPESNLLCYWIVDSKTPKEISEYVTNGIYEGKMRTLRGLAGTQGKAVVSCYLTEAKLASKTIEGEAKVVH